MFYDHRLYANAGKSTRGSSNMKFLFSLWRDKKGFFFFFLIVFVTFQFLCFSVFCEVREAELEPFFSSLLHGGAA